MDIEEKYLNTPINILDSNILDIINYKNWIIFCAANNIIYICNKEFKITKTLEYHSDIVFCLAIYKNYLISGSEDLTIKIFNWDDNYKLTYSIDKQHKDSIKSLCVYKNLLISGTEDGKINIFNILDEYKLKHTIDNQLDSINNLLTYNNYLISGCRDGLIKVYNLNYNFKLLKEINIHTKSIKNLIIYNHSLITNSYDKNIFIINLKSKFKITNIINNEERIRTINIYKNFLTLISNDSIKIHDLNYNNFIVKTIDINIKNINSSIFINNHIIIACKDNLFVLNINKYLKIYEDNLFIIKNEKIRIIEKLNNIEDKENLKLKLLEQDKKLKLLESTQNTLIGEIKELKINNKNLEEKLSNYQKNVIKKPNLDQLKLDIENGNNIVKSKILKLESEFNDLKILSKKQELEQNSINEFLVI